MTTLTLDAVVASLHKAVAQAGPDYIYDRPICRYSNEDGTPSCIVGRVLADLDPELFEKVRAFERLAGVSPSIGSWGSGRWAYSAIPPLDIEPSERKAVVAFLTEAQNVQDAWHRWALVEERARAALSAHLEYAR